jgi:serine/threonine protein kinase
MDILTSEPTFSVLMRHCREPFIKILQAMLQRDPDDRPTIDECLQSQWFTNCEELPKKKVI